MSVRRNNPQIESAALPAHLQALVVEDWVSATDDADEARRRSWFINGNDHGTDQLAQALKIVACTRRRRARANWAAEAGADLARLNAASPPPRAVFRDYAAFVAELGDADPPQP